MTTSATMDRTMTQRSSGRPTATLSITLARYAGPHLRHRLSIARDGAPVVHGWYDSRREAARAGRQWARINRVSIQWEASS